MVGGISRTVERDGWRFDIGGHRFFTKVQPVEDLWHEILPDEDFLHAAPHEPHLLRRQVLRLPAQGRQRAAQPRPVEAVRCVGPTSGPASARRRTRRTRGLARRPLRLAPLPHFFKTYTEKVWGVPVSEMPADWAAQRIKDLSLGKRHRQRAHCPSGTRRRSPRLIEEFQYPKYGPGMMWEVCRDKVVAQGSKVVMQTRGHQDPPRGRPGRRGRSPSTRAAAPPSYPCTDVISSMPISAAARGHGPAGAGRGAWPRPTTSRYRDFLTVALVVPRGGRLRRQLDLHPRPRGASRCASRTSARGRRTW